MATKEEKMEAFGHLLDILDELRVKCPWDRKQTNESLRTNTIEETYELCDAIMKNDNANIKKELGRLAFAYRFLCQNRRREKGVRHQGCMRQPLPKAHLSASARFRERGRRHASEGRTKLGTTETQRKRRKQNRLGRCAKRAAFHRQSPTHSGQGAQCRFRLGTARTGVGQGSGRIYRAENRN